MSFESIKQPINADNLALHDKELEKKLLEIQLGFAAAKMKEAAGANFSEVLDRHTTILEDLARRFEENKLESVVSFARRINESAKAPDKIIEYLDKESETAAGLAETKEGYLERLRNRIDQLYQESPDRAIELVGQYLSQESEALGEAPPSDRPENPVGPFRYQLRDGFGKSLRDFGIGDADECLEIHFERLYRQKDRHQGLSFKTIRADLEKLAEVIVKNYPQTKAVVGTSWLMSSQAAPKLGFTVIDIEPTDEKVKMDTWSQFIDKDGQINRQRLEKFISTGAPPVKSRTGVMTVEDFLRRHLPPHWRGKEIALKEVDPRFPESLRELQTTAKRIKEKWGKISAEEIKKLIHGSPLISRAIGSPEGRAWHDFILEALDKNYKSWEEMRRDNAAALEELGKKFEAVLLVDKYRDKKIVIE